MAKTITRVTLSPAMASMLLGTEILKVNDVRGNTNTVVALIERGMALAGVENLLTDAGRRVAKLIASDQNLYDWAHGGGSRSRTIHIPAKD